MEIICIGHSGFLVRLPKLNLIFDYFRDAAGVITPEIFGDKGTKTCVFASHSHEDHYNPEIFRWKNICRGPIAYVIESGCGVIPSADTFIMNEGMEIDVLDGLVHISTYGSTDIGVSFLVKTPFLTMFHAGDLNDWYWEGESTPEELAGDEENYLAIIRKLSGKKIDLAFVPRDPRLGKNASKGVDFFREIVKPGRIVPMHFPGNDGVTY